MLRISAATWGFIGVVAFLSFAVYRLLQHTLQAMDQPLSLLQWSLLIINVVFMAYSEGYKGFQKSFSPRVAARVLYLSRHATLVEALFAPLFCLGYFGTSRKRQLSVMILTIALIVLVMVVKELSQPWRGIVDAGVVVGLSWGVVSFIVFVIQAFTVDDFPYSAEVHAQSNS